MLVHIMRHGVAVDRGDPDYPDDADRPLTAEGRKKTRAAARGLRAVDADVDWILSSPLTRARQTAEIVAMELRVAPNRVRETASLEPGAPPAELFRELARVPALESVLLVGHEPDLSDLMSLLLAGVEGALDVPLKKATVALIETQSMPPAERGRLRWLLSPKQLRLLGRTVDDDE